MKKHAKCLVSLVLCLAVIAGVWVGHSMMRVDAQIANNLNPKDKKQTETYMKKNSLAQIGTKENPFTIVEIVPNRSLARLGYLIPGCEPIDMDKLSVDEIAYGMYAGMFIGNADSNIAWKEDAVTDVFADQIPAGATVREPWVNVEQYKNMAPADTTWVTWEKNYGMWKFVANGLTQTGYYEKRSDSSGWFDLVTDDNGSKFVYNSSHKGEYNWVEAENTQNRETDYQADQVWTTRTEAGYFETKKYVIHNRDSLIQHAFQSSTEEGFVSQVISLTPQDLEKDSNLDYLKEADLICISEEQDDGLRQLWNLTKKDGQEEVDSSAPTYFQKENDVPWKAVKTITECMAGENPPALILSKTTYDNTKSKNLNKLAIMVLEYRPEFFVDYYFDMIDENGVYTDENGKKHDEWVKSMNPSENTFDLSYAQNKNISEGASEIVYGNVYSYSNFNIFTQGFTKKNYPETTKNAEAFEWYEDQTGKRPDKLSANDFIYFILHGRNYRTNVDLHILEVEPTNEFIGDVQKKDLSYTRIEDHLKSCKKDDCSQCQKWKKYYRTLLPWIAGDLKKQVLDGKITITRMASWEFIGKIDDLNSEYDMIVFGATQNQANGKDGYNDTLMNGLIYSSIGDKVIKVGGENRDRAEYTMLQSDDVIRYSGNDLTAKKVKELKSFMAAGKPVIVDERFYKDAGKREVDVNNARKDNNQKGTVDVDSQVYQLFSLANDDKYKNHLYITGQVDQSGLLSDVVRNSCKITFNTENGTGYPKEYSYTENGGAIRKDSVQYVDGHTLVYQFQVKGSKSRNYRVNLYIDRNGDGIYKGSLKDPASGQKETEQIGNLTISDQKGNPIQADRLEAGEWYTITQKLPASYVGILPWKLEIYDTDNSNLRNSVSKYCAIKTTEENREKIKVLQMNLTYDMNSQPSEALIMDTKSSEGGDNAKKFKKFLDGVNDFEVTIDFMKNEDWKNKFCKNGTTESKINAWESYLDDYDMLILGFSDSAVFTENSVFQAGFEYFVDQGKSVILSHDICRNSTYNEIGNPEKLKSITYDGRIRDLMGQRRYKSGTWSLQGGEVSLISGKDGEKEKGNLGVYKYSSFKAVQKGENGQEYYIPDYSDAGVDLYLKFGPNTTYQTYHDGVKESKNKNAAADRIALNTKFEGGLGKTTRICLDNRGQITHYPYILDEQDMEKLDVAETHQQWHQLDMDNEDLVVWYSLSDDSQNGTGIYSSRENDARNQYYIYNIGNITYTGMGHSGNKETLPDSEVKLFVNTMISAYRATTGNPYVEITNPDKQENSSTEAYLYAEIDPDNFSYDKDSTMDVTFKITDPAFGKSKQETKTNALQFVDASGSRVLSASEHPDLYNSADTVMKETVSTSEWDSGYIYLKKPTNWTDKVYCYVYDGSSNNGAWPGVPMVKMENGIYQYKIPSSIKNPKVMFNTGSDKQQYPATGQPGLEVPSGTKFIDGTAGWSWSKAKDFSGAEDAYEVAIDGNYYFKVNYKELIEKGQLDYYLCLKTKTERAGKIIYNKRITKVSVLPLPLFNLD